MKGRGIGRRRCVAGLSLVFAGAAAVARAQASYRALASFSILADFAREVAGDAVAIRSLAGPDIDAHGYAPTPSDARAVAAADLLIVNGLGFDAWAERLAGASGFKGRLAVASRSVATIRISGGAHTHGHGHAHGRGGVDPHLWQDPLRARAMVANLAEDFAAIDPAGATGYRTRAEAYGGRLAELDSWIKAEFAPVPKDRRRIFTSHDAFGYFEARYGVDFRAPRGVNMDGEPSAADIGRIVREIRREKARVVFLENVSSPRLIEQIARESGARIGGRLYTDALSAAGGTAATYIDLMRHNVGLLRAAMLAD